MDQLTAIAKQIANLPGATLIKAAQDLSPPACVRPPFSFDKISSKEKAVIVLSMAIHQGQTTVAAVQAAATQETAATTTLTGAATASAAARAEAVALESKAIAEKTADQLGALMQQGSAIATAVETLSRDLGTLRDIKSDPRAVAAAIQAEVDKQLKVVVKAAKANKTIESVIAATRAPTVKTVAEVFGLNILDIKGNPLTVEHWADPEAPAIDNTYIWQESIVRALVTSAATGTPLWFGGDKGTGKTQAAMQWAARTGRAFTRINFHKYTSAEEYLGATGLVNGQTQFVPGAFLDAYTRPGSVILLDEITNADPGELAPLNGALERGTTRVNIGGREWNRAPGVMVIAADNTLANGDASGRYSGTRVMNSALADRFGYIVPVTWLPRDQEIDALVRLTGCQHKLATLVVSMLAACRSKAADGDLVDAPSIRSAIAWIEAMPVLGVRAAWDISVASRQPSESAVALEAIFQSEVNIPAFEAQLQ